MALLQKTRPSLSRPNNRIWRAALLSLTLLAPGGLAASTVTDQLPNAELRGSATFRYLGLPIYDAKLYTPDGAAFSWNENFGLQLTYRKNLKQKALVESTLDEIERQGNSAPSQAQLEQCFQAVSKGDSYLAISEGPNAVGFWRNGRKTCTLTNPGVKKSFMSIFLGNNTRSASFTRQLKGQ
ncbi:hypothetical protein [Ruegeria sp. Ofav3-42]|uniref:hypothetical protein n=1 Tax=Ruegeria sp. Ofav3-42 TaxID=2917759 RepID=UPI001EF6AD30|nr:hypothetical protein [Ruegeria sp. Ofav3-42]MCG7521154.1 hypothetical protein [Ruegeria sp. Ofav3-42]